MRKIIEKIEDKYKIKVLAMDDVYVIYEKNDYTYKCRRDNLSRVTSFDSLRLMLPTSYIKYLNNTVFLCCPLIAIDITNDVITIINTETNEYTTVTRGNINLETLLNITSKTKKYREEIIESLGEAYNYDKCIPTKLDNKVTITCPIHGDFCVTPANAIYKHSGCPICGNEYRGFSRTSFIKACDNHTEDGNGLLYVIKVTRGDESFIKVGITSFSSLDNRLRELNKIDCKIEELLVNRGAPHRVYNLEKYIHRNMKHKQYLPTFDFNGRQECYTLDALPEILDIICKKWKKVL